MKLDKHIKPTKCETTVNIASFTSPVSAYLQASQPGIEIELAFAPGTALECGPGGFRVEGGGEALCGTALAAGRIWLEANEAVVHYPPQPEVTQYPGFRMIVRSKLRVGES